MRIQTNTAANSALGYMRVNNAATERSIQKLSSGFRINRAADDAAGLAIANKLRSDIKGLGQAQRNVAQGSAMLQVMDGSAQTVSTIVDRMKELATQANSANVGTQADKLQGEFTQLRSEIDRIVNTTNYQGTKLVDGSFGARPAVAGSALVPATVASAVAGLSDFSASITGATAANALTGDLTLTATATGFDVTGGGMSPFSVTVTSAQLTSGATVALTGTGISLTFAAGTTRPTAGTTGIVDVTTSIPAVTAIPAASTSGSFMVSSSGAYAFGEADLVQVQAVNLGTGSTALNLAGLDISTQAGAAGALTRIDAATNVISSALGAIGAAQSRMDFASANVATQLQNTQAAESTIRDADMAAEMTSFTKSNILQQAAQSMLSQANQGTQGILQLLRG